MTESKKELPTATLDDLLARGPCSCWLRDGREEKLRALSARRDRWTILDLLDLVDSGEVPLADALWAGTRCGLLPDWTWRLFAADCAERALVRARADGREPDRRSWEAVRVARDHALGVATDEERRAAYAVACAASRARAAIAADAVVSPKPASFSAYIAADAAASPTPASASAKAARYAAEAAADDYDAERDEQARSLRGLVAWARKEGRL